MTRTLTSRVANTPKLAHPAGHKTSPGMVPHIVASDAELLRLFARHAGSIADTIADDAFAQILDRHNRMVWRVCHQILHRQQDAEDAFQVTFLFLARRARSIRASESVAGWLYRVAHRTAMNAKHKSRRRNEKPLVDEPAEVAFPNLARREMAAVMMEELRRLPAKYQTPLVMRYLEGQSRRQIAEQTDSTIATVQGQLARGKQLLRSRLLRRGVSLSAAMAIVGNTNRQAEAASAHLIAQTTSNATAIATGGSLTASVAVVSLYREGVRGMLFSSLTKTIASLSVIALLVAGIALRGSQAQTKAVAKPSLQLLAEAPAEAPTEAAATAFSIESIAQPTRATSNDDGAIYPETYRTVDLQHVFQSLSLEDLSKHITQSIAPNSWADNNPESEDEIRTYPDDQKLVISANQKKHERIAEALKLLLRVASSAGEIENPKKEPVFMIGDSTIVTSILPSGEKQQISARVDQLGELDLTKHGREGYGKVKVVGRTHKQVVKAIADQIRAAHDDSSIQVGLQHNRTGVWDEGPIGKRADNATSKTHTQHKIAPGDRIEIKSVGVDSNNPLRGEFFIEPSGTVPLGPTYGRVKVAGLNITEAEAAIQKHLSANWSDPVVQLTALARTASVNRTTPTNGTIVENWPNGNPKSEYVYRDGKIVSALEYSEDGVTLYEMNDDGEKQPPDNQQSELKKQALPKSPTPKQMRAILEEQLSRLVSKREHLRQSRLPTSSTASDIERRISQKMLNLQTRIEQLVSAEAEQMINETEQFLDKHFPRTESATPKRSAKSPPQDAAVKESPRIDNQFETVEELVERAEAVVQLAEQIAEQARLAHGLNEDPNKFTTAKLDDVAAKALRNVTEKKTSLANQFLNRAESTLESLFEKAVDNASRASEVDIVKTLDSLQEKSKSLEQRIQAVRQRASRAKLRSTYHPVKFKPDESVTGSEWTVYDKPSEINPNGWAVRAKLAFGGSMPIPLPGDKRPRPEVQFVATHSKGITLGTNSSSDLQGKGERQTFILYRDKPFMATIHGQEVVFYLRTQQVYGDQPKTSPYVWIDILQSKAGSDK